MLLLFVLSTKLVFSGEPYEGKLSRTVRERGRYFALPNGKPIASKVVSTLVHYNSIITAHAILMIFFMVEKYYILRLQPFTFFKVNDDNKNSLFISESSNCDDDHFNKNQDYNNSSQDEDNQDENNHNKKNSVACAKKHNYVKVLVDDPYNNRDIILKVTKKQKGVYV
jgi:hypothetical protein